MRLCLRKLFALARTYCKCDKTKPTSESEVYIKQQENSTNHCYTLRHEK